jgi:hypothetical protein
MREMPEIEAGLLPDARRNSPCAVERKEVRDLVAGLIQVMDRRSGRTLVSLALNISRDACTVETTAPFDKGTTVQLTIRKDGQEFKTSGTVVRCASRKSMVIRFDHLAHGEQIAARFGEDRPFWWL